MVKESEPLTIEHAREEDLPEILALLHAAFRSEAELTGNFAIAPLCETLEELRATARVRVLLKAVADGAIVGTGRADCRDGTIHLGRLAVKPGLQGRGIGSALIAALEGLFPDAARCEIFTSVYSEKNIRLYAKHSYREVSRRGTPEGVTLVVMEKLRGVPQSRN
jgi:ribosomal protein S18 acetylase RimI-like enzyme